MEKAFVKVLPGPLTFLPAGEVVRDPLELLSPDRLLPFLDLVRQMFDVVVMDSPPVLPVADARVVVWLPGPKPDDRLELYSDLVFREMKKFDQHSVL